jgi:hypothetical protein
MAAAGLLVAVLAAIGLWLRRQVTRAGVVDPARPRRA